MTLFFSPLPQNLPTHLPCTPAHHWTVGDYPHLPTSLSLGSPSGLLLLPSPAPMLLPSSPLSCPFVILPAPCGLCVSLIHPRDCWIQASSSVSRGEPFPSSQCHWLAGLLPVSFLLWVWPFQGRAPLCRLTSPPLSQTPCAGLHAFPCTVHRIWIASPAPSRLPGRCPSPPGRPLLLGSSNALCRPPSHTPTAASSTLPQEASFLPPLSVLPLASDSDSSVFPLEPGTSLEPGTGRACSPPT